MVFSSIKFVKKLYWFTARPTFLPSFWAVTWSTKLLLVFYLLLRAMLAKGTDAVKAMQDHLTQWCLSAKDWVFSHGKGVEPAVPIYAFTPLLHDVLQSLLSDQSTWKYTTGIFCNRFPLRSFVGQLVQNSLVLQSTSTMQSAMIVHCHSKHKTHSHRHPMMYSHRFTKVIVVALSLFYFPLYSFPWWLLSVSRAGLSQRLAVFSILVKALHFWAAFFNPCSQSWTPKAYCWVQTQRRWATTVSSVLSWRWAITQGLDSNGICTDALYSSISIVTPLKKFPWSKGWASCRNFTVLEHHAIALHCS